MTGDWSVIINFECSSTAKPEDLRAVSAGLDEYNLAEPQMHNVQQLSVLARDSAGQITGGAIGRTWGKCCELQQLWVSTEARSLGMGTGLMDRFEHEALQRGCLLVYLDTFSFQARPFYEKRGFQVALETHGFTNGIVKYTMHKRLG